MSFFGLDPESLEARFSNGEELPAPASFWRSLFIGMGGGVAMSLAGFAPWFLAGKPLSKMFGTVGMYGVCMVAFILVSGLTLHWLLVGRGSLLRFYKLFATSFVVFSVAWTAGWVTFRDPLGSVIGFAVGALAMSAIFCAAFQSFRQMLAATLLIYLPTLAGYFLGGVVEAAMWRSAESRLDQIVAMSFWGVFFGIGFGAGIGLAIHVCQRPALLAARKIRADSRASRR